MNESKSQSVSAILRLLNRRQVGEMCNVHPGTVKRWEASGQLRPIKINARVTRYDEAEVRRFIQGARCA